MKTLIFSFVLVLTTFVFGQQDLPLETVLQKGHTDYIRAYDFSPDNQFVVTGGFDNVLLLWDVQRGKQIRTFTGHTERIRSVSFSPDQLNVLSVSADNTIKIFEVLTGRLLHSFSVSNREFYRAYYGHSGKYVYALDNRDGVYVWDAETGEEVGLYRKEYAAHNEEFVIHPTQDKILSAGDYKKSYVVSLTSQDTLLELPFDKAHSQSFSPDGKWIAISSRKLFASVFNSETGDLVNEFRFGEERCDGCNTKHVFSPDSKYLVTMSNKVGAILWDVRSGKKLKSFLEPDARPRELVFSKSGKFLLINFSDDVYVFDTRSGNQKIHVTSDKIDYFDFKFDSNEQYIALPNDQGGVDLWDVSKGRLVKTIRGYLNEDHNNGLNLSYSNWIDQSILNYIQHKRKVLLSPNGTQMMIGNVDTTAMLLDLFTGRVVKVFEGHSKSVIAFDFSPDGNYVATGGGDRHIKIWETSTGKEVATLKGHQETIFDLAFSKDGEFIISGSWDGTMRLWQWRSGKYEYIPFNKNSPYCVGFTPNELYVVTGDLDKNVQFWERDAAEPFRTLIGHTSIPSGFDFSPDQKNMVTSSWDGNVKLWDVLTGMLIGKMPNHQGQVYAVKYDPKARFIASAGADSRILLWDPVKNEIVKELIGHSTAITDLDISKDGKYLVSISVDGLVKLWDLDTYEEVYSRIQMSRDDWLATNKSGYFDGSSNALGWVNYVKGNQVVNVNNLFDKYYTPGLIERISKNEEGLNDRGEKIESQMGDVPHVVVALSGAGKRSVVMPDDSIFYAQKSVLPIEVEVSNNETPLDEIRIYNNGKLIIHEEFQENIVFRGDGKKRSFEVPLSNGLNELTAVVVNTERTESEPTSVLVEYKGNPEKTDLYILSIGINNYKNPAYNLDYAVNDSKTFLKTIESGADSLFNSVVSYSIHNSNATKAQILEVIAEIKGQIGSEDVFLFYYAGHGVMSNAAVDEESEFFIVTHDVTNLYDSPEVIREKAIAASELMAISIGVAAEKQLFILDACHSGGAIESFAVRGSEREKALAQLARNTGTFFLTAAQDAQYANEVGKLNHGLFTYALLEILQGTIEAEGADRKITVNELKSYVEERVPELSEEYHGSPQYPTGYSFGRDFPIVILK